MLRTLKLSLALRNAHHANALIYAAGPYPADTQAAARQRPTARIPPRRLATVLGALWELASTVRRSKRAVLF